MEQPKRCEFGEHCPERRLRERETVETIEKIRRETKEKFDLCDRTKLTTVTTDSGTSINGGPWNFQTTVEKIRSTSPSNTMPKAIDTKRASRVSLAGSAETLSRTVDLPPQVYRKESITTIPHPDFPTTDYRPPQQAQSGRSSRISEHTIDLHKESVRSSLASKHTHSSDKSEQKLEKKSHLAPEEVVVDTPIRKHSSFNDDLSILYRVEEFNESYRSRSASTHSKSAIGKETYPASPTTPVRASTTSSKSKRSASTTGHHLHEQEVTEKSHHPESHPSRLSTVSIKRSSSSTSHHTIEKKKESVVTTTDNAPPVVITSAPVDHRKSLSTDSRCTTPEPHLVRSSVLDRNEKPRSARTSPHRSSSHKSIPVAVGETFVEHPNVDKKEKGSSISRSSSSRTITEVPVDAQKIDKNAKRPSTKSTDDQGDQPRTDKSSASSRRPSSRVTEIYVSTPKALKAASRPSSRAADAHVEAPQKTDKSSSSSRPSSRGTEIFVNTPKAQKAASRPSSRTTDIYPDPPKASKGTSRPSSRSSVAYIYRDEFLQCPKPADGDNTYPQQCEYVIRLPAPAPGQDRHYENAPRRDSRRTSSPVKRDVPVQKAHGPSSRRRSSAHPQPHPRRDSFREPPRIVYIDDPYRTHRPHLREETIVRETFEKVTSTKKYHPVTSV